MAQWRLSSWKKTGGYPYSKQPFQELDRQEVQHLLFQRLEARYLQLKQNPKVIRANYLQNLYRYQEWHSFQDTTSGQIFTGQIIGVQETGKLAIQMEQNHVQYFDLKEVAFL